MSHHAVHHRSLWGSAIVLVGLILLQSGGDPGPSVQADMLTQGGGYTMLTLGGRHAAQDNDVDAVIILDNTAGWLLAYEISGSRPNRHIELLDGGPISRLFDHGHDPGTASPSP